jgi:hypothetical protein
MVLENIRGKLHQLNESELATLNSLVIDQLKRSRRETSRLAKLRFQVGDKVGFGNRAKRGKRSYKEGTITSIKRTRAEVLVFNTTWTVPLNMLQAL